MAALSAGAGRDTRHNHLTRQYEHLVETSAKCYQGGIIALDATTGYAQAATNTAGATRGYAVGIAEETVTGDGSTKYIKCIAGCEAKFTVTASVVTALREGAKMYVKTDNEVTTATNAGTVTKRVFVGWLTEFITTSTGWVLLAGHSDSDV